MKKIIQYSIFFLFIAGWLVCAPNNVFAHQPRLVYNQAGEIKIIDPELSQAFYDQLGGSSRAYNLTSEREFELYLNLLVPEPSNFSGRYSAKIYLADDNIVTLDGNNFEWTEFYEEFGRDYYLKGPEFSQVVPAGNYRVEIYSNDNQGKYVLAVGKKEFYDFKVLVNVYWQLPLLKVTFFKTSVLQFFLTPFGIGLIAFIGFILILWAAIYYLIGFIKQTTKHNQAKTLLLASSFSQMQDEVVKLLQKPAYDVTVGFITTASKEEENIDYLQRDLLIMREELSFNVEEVDIEGKTESQVMKLLEAKDIIFVEGGSTSYLLKAMKGCNFGKVIKKLLKQGQVYIGASAGSKVAGKMGLKLVPYDIFPHYQPKDTEIIKQQMPDSKNRAKNLRILTDEQAILVQGKDSYLIGEGEAVII